MTIDDLKELISKYKIPYTIQEEYRVVYQNTKRLIGYCLEAEGQKFYAGYKQTILLKFLRWLEENRSIQ